MNTLLALPNAIRLWLLQYTPLYLVGVMLGGDKPMSLPAMIEAERYFVIHRRRDLHEYGAENHLDKCLICGDPKP
jgi:hypothetical protein